MGRLGVLTTAQIDAYRRDGFIVVPDVLAPAEVEELRAVTDDLVARARFVREHDALYDLEPSHTPARPRVRRLKMPHVHHDAYARVMRHPTVLAILRQLVAPAIRFDTSKLNMKAAGYGAAVEWHQDWAFYPHTNDDLCAVGVMMDDCALENGPLLCIPGSHRGPVHDHHAEGVFCGAIDPATPGIDFAAAIACTGKAGSISIHHARTIHGSAINTSDRMRRLFLLQYRAADAWPLVGGLQPAFDAYRDLLLCGEDEPRVPRLAPVPVRLPLPAALHQGSIYENQRGLKATFFGTAQVEPEVAPAT
jgi:ectoine hydroxylase-related dioxygenase (phytanoyl-CoA dioxygenase family)